MERITLGALVGKDLEEEFPDFDLTEIQSILKNLTDTDVIDLAHAENLQQQTLRGADILSEYLARIIKTSSYLDSKVSAAKNKASLEYKDPDGGKTTADMKKNAGECAPVVMDLAAKVAYAKGSKSLLEKKYDIIIRAHHHYKDLAAGMRKSILGFSNKNNAPVPEGWE